MLRLESLEGTASESKLYLLFEPKTLLSAGSLDPCQTYANSFKTRVYSHPS